jgi:aminoglycoside N3'-acetyltransferase
MEDLMLNEKDFYKAFNEVITKKDEVIVLYSSIYNFIFNIKFTSKNIPKTLLDILEKITTKSRTLILPAFSANSFLKENRFDIKKSIDNIGVLPKEALKRNYFRTVQPLHSYLVYGKEKKLVEKLKHLTSWGETSILGYMRKRNARICTFGLPWNKGCSYLHRFEELSLVPWRYFKLFEGSLYINGKKMGNCFENKYSAPLNGVLEYDFKPFVPHIKNSKSYKKSSNQIFNLESVKTSCLDKIGNKIFSKNPWIIVKNKRNIKDWIKRKKIKEVFSGRTKSQNYSN